MSIKKITFQNENLNDSPKNQLEATPVQENKSLSPKENYFSNIQSFSTEINQRNFPSKENYFKYRNTQRKIDRTISPKKQSPVLSYFANLSPKNSKFSQYYSPELNKGGESAKHSPLIGNNEQTFNFSPSTIFNKGNQKNNNNPNNINKKYEGLNNSISLAEKMQHLVGKNDNKNQYNDQKSEEEDDNSDNEMYLLSFNICDDKDNEEELNNHDMNNFHKNNENLNQYQINTNNNLNSNNFNRNIGIQSQTTNLLNNLNSAKKFIQM